MPIGDDIQLAQQNVFVIIQKLYIYIFFKCVFQKKR